MNVAFLIFVALYTVDLNAVPMRGNEGFSLSKAIETTCNVTFTLKLVLLLELLFVK